MTLSITISEPAWQYVCDKANAAALAALPENNRESFVPVMLEEYVQNRINELSASYAQQEIQDLAKDPVIAARFLKVLSQPQEVRDQFAAQVDAL